MSDSHSQMVKLEHPDAEVTRPQDQKRWRLSPVAVPELWQARHILAPSRGSSEPVCLLVIPKITNCKC